MELWNYFVLCFISYKSLDMFIDVNLMKFNRFMLVMQEIYCTVKMLRYANLSYRTSQK